MDIWCTTEKSNRNQLRKHGLVTGHIRSFDRNTEEEIVSELVAARAAGWSRACYRRKGSFRTIRRIVTSVPMPCHWVNPSRRILISMEEYRKFSSSHSFTILRQLSTSKVSYYSPIPVSRTNLHNCQTIAVASKRDRLQRKVSLRDALAQA